MKIRICIIAAVFALVAVGSGQALAASPTLDSIKSRGALKCGITTALAGFAFADKRGVWRGFDVDFCRALAAALGVKVKFIPTNAKERFPALQSGEVDVLFRNTTWTLSRDTRLGFDFAGVNYYDGQGFMVRKDSGIKSAKDLDGATVCVNAGTTTELNLGDYFRSNGMKYKAVVYETGTEVRQAYEAGRCDVHTTDASGLAAQRSAMKVPGDHIILPEIISKEPLGPAVRHGDNEWGDIVRWVLNAIIIAEEKGLTQGNVSRMAISTKDPEVQRLLGKTGSVGDDLGLDPDWALKAIRKIGNYGEVFERNIGKKTPLALARGLNQLWSKGGILYAPPVR
ncbi:MAG: amino acid ABC transporter substrate-binding protein [SAR324 cluster bacterium]|nr:amino acid ABC transporter substrate-binding protein [SAR324 cluster bacterium]MCZ6646605.1 amino acid ABC transporter substrate-binding protein [SAR324 cluster bacterium]